MNNYKHGGYDKKYIIAKSNGKPVDRNADYFVLRLDKDPHAIIALEAYKESVKDDNPELAEDLIFVINKNRGIQSRRLVREVKDGNLC